LKKLSLQSNRLSQIQGLENLLDLEELYLSSNGITKLEGLDNLTSLRVLDVASNQLTTLENIAHLIHLEEFWCNDNKLDHFEVLQQLANASHLDTVYFEGNPLALDPLYRIKVHTALPPVTQIDATFIQTPPKTTS